MQKQSGVLIDALKFCCFTLPQLEPGNVLQEGIIALWKGWLPSVIGVIPYVGLNFAVYETLKDHVLKYYGKPPKSCSTAV